MKVVRVSFYEPNAAGDGGYHRAYQVVHDLEQAVGRDNLIHANVPPPWYPWQPWPAPEAERRPLRQRLANRVRRLTRPTLRRLTRRLRNPYSLLAPTHYSPTGYLTGGFLAYYTQLVARLREPAVCVLENTAFSEVIAINARHHLPTLSCAQNIEAFDTASQGGSAWSIHSAAVDFAAEFKVLAQCRERLVISRVEAGLIGGLGLATRFYPYLPVGEIETRLAHLRAERQQGGVEPGLFLMIGSAGHNSTRASFQWFCEQAQQHGLPPGARVVVAGNGTDTLLPAGAPVAGLELRGWAEQDALDDLLRRAQAVLVPQRSGFGALTRLPELACAGIPALVSAHPLLAMDPPPGLVVADDDWSAWSGAMQRLAASAPAASEAAANEAAYGAWQERQPRPLGQVLRSLEGGVP